MRILTRYVFREFCVPLAYCLAGFISIYVLFELFGSFSRLMKAKPDFGTVVLYFASYLAPYFKYVAPACLMLATLYTMWSFCRHSELIAMRASGIGFFAIVKPLLVASALMAGFVAWVDEVYVPKYAQWAKQFRESRFGGGDAESDGKASAEKKGRSSRGGKKSDLSYVNTVANRKWDVKKVVSDDAHVLEDVRVDVQGTADKPKMTINAERVQYMDGQWWFFDPKVTYHAMNGEEVLQNTPATDSKLSLRTFPGFDERPEDLLFQNRDWAFCSVSDRMRYLETNISLSPEKRRDYRYDIYDQIFAPLACIIITLFAIPAGIATGRQSVFKGIVGALCMFFAFYGLVLGCMILAKRGMCPPFFAALFPHVVFLGIGGWLFWRQR